MTRIAICAPATPITREIAAAVRDLAAREFPALELAFHEQCFVQDGHFAGADDVRLAALLDCANDPGSDTVWFAKGGYGSNRIAQAALDRMGPAAQSKTFLGYSDMGYLLAGLYHRKIGYPVHGPMVLDIQRSGGDMAVRRSLGWLAGDDCGREPGLDDRPAVAFNLMTLAMLCGTDLMPDLVGHVVMVEEVSEHLYAVDRLFFALMPHLKGCAGLRLGAISDVPENDRPFGSTAEEIARYWCERSGVPYLGRAAIGHTADNHIVPFGLAVSPPGA